ncbi:hypothetical protein [Shewanella sp. ENK2]|uniref:hypothetical protein n=1 Tax=Shewanella sp. ENK2 TaxID=2775245 RepID=UPI003749CFE9
MAFLRKKIELNIPNIGSAIRDKNNSSIVISILDGEYPKFLHVYDLLGNFLMELAEPEGFEFYYIKNNKSQDVSIVCSSEKRIDGRLDWQFLIDYEAKNLYRYCPSY